MTVRIRNSESQFLPAAPLKSCFAHWHTELRCCFKTDGRFRCQCCHLLRCLKIPSMFSVCTVSYLLELKGSDFNFILICPKKFKRKILRRILRCRSEHAWFFTVLTPHPSNLPLRSFEVRTYILVKFGCKKQ